MTTKQTDIDTGCSLVNKHKLKMKQKNCNHGKTKSYNNPKSTLYNDNVICIYCGKDVTN